MQVQETPTSQSFRAPKVARAWPFLGHGPAFGADPDAFLASCRARHGDVFTLMFPDGPRVFLLEPRDYQTVLSHKQLLLEDFATSFGSKAFGYDFGAAKALGNHEMSRMVLRHLSGDPLDVASQAMQRLLVARMAEEVPSTPVERGLLAFVTRQVFAAGTDAIFGEGSYADPLYEAFSRIDRALPLLYLGVPTFLLPGVHAARTFAATHLVGQRKEPSTLVAERRSRYADHGTAPVDAGRMDTSLLWAAQANTVLAVFWAVFHVLRDATAREAVLAELRALSPGGDDVFDRAALKKMELLDAVLDEVFRVASAPLLPRRATDDVMLSLVAGTLDVRRGETLCLYPRAMQLDPEIFEDPGSFRFDRFLPVDGKPPRFEKRGQRLSFPLLPFGAGPSMCPGRHFARNEMKLVVATLLTRYDVTLLETAVPPFEASRIGFGTIPPKSDVRMRIARRA